jgi:hypothetical protein
MGQGLSGNMIGRPLPNPSRENMISRYNEDGTFETFFDDDIGANLDIDPQKIFP